VLRGSSSQSQTVAISSDIDLPSIDANSASDPSQSDGIKQEVKDAASAALGASGLAVATQIGQPSVSAAPLGSADDYAKGADASAATYGVFALPGDNSASGVDTYADNGNGFTIPNSSGGEDTIAAPDPASFDAASDPIALTIKDVDPGATISFDFYLPQTVADSLPADLSQATYLSSTATRGPSWITSTPMAIPITATR
jgi:hypothetical protein